MRRPRVGRTCRQSVPECGSAGHRQHSNLGLLLSGSHDRRVSADRSIRQAEVGAAKKMIERTEERFGIKPERLAADTAYGSAPTLHWLVDEKQIAPHIPVIDKSKRDDGTFSRDEFTFDRARDLYICPAGKVLTTTGTIVNDEQLLYRASKRDCGVCPFKMRCCPKEPVRKIPHSIYEEARDIARALAKTAAFERSSHDRKRVEMLFAHLKRILKLGRLRLRGPRSAQDEFTLAAIAQNLRRAGQARRTTDAHRRHVSWIRVNGSWRCIAGLQTSPSKPRLPTEQAARQRSLSNSSRGPLPLVDDFCNKICQELILPGVPNPQLQCLRRYVLLTPSQVERTRFNGNANISSRSDPKSLQCDKCTQE
jgi:hypothetical protein